MNKGKVIRINRQTIKRLKAVARVRYPVAQIRKSLHCSWSEAHQIRRQLPTRLSRVA